MGQNKQAGAKNLPIFKKKKRGALRPKKQAGAELKKKKKWGKIDQFSKSKVAGINFLSSINFLAGIKKMFGWN